MKLLIDGDIICFRAGFAAERTKYVATQGTVINNGPATFIEYFDDAKGANEWAKAREHALVWSRKEVQDVDQALMIASVMIKDIRERYAAENPTVIVFLSGVGNFRFGIATRATYKGNRSGSVPPVHLKAIRNDLIAKGAIISSGEEADDMLGIAATESPGSVVCSIDKDLLQLPGRHYNFVTKEEVTISNKEAVLNFYSQVLSGDSTDNVPGLTGIGPAKARKALEDCHSPLQCWERCLSMYVNEFTESRGEQYALEAARLVYVRRTPDELWTPPSSRSKASATKAPKAQRVA